MVGNCVLGVVGRTTEGTVGNRAVGIFTTEPPPPPPPPLTPPVATTTGVAVVVSS